MANGQSDSDGELTVGVLGLGHVGLVTALTLAELGWSVVGADDDADKARRIARGEAPFFEPGLPEALRDHLGSGRFRVAQDVPTAIREATVLFVCVSTPQRPDGSADLSYIESVSRAIAQHRNGYKLVVEKSTTPVNTADRIKQTILRYGDGEHEFDVAVNPEFLREGTSLHDSLNPDRIVLGVESERAQELLTRIYQPLVKSSGASVKGPDGSPASGAGRAHLLVSDLNTAELVKHAANAMLALRISFINLVADLCEATGADISEVAHGVGLDPRIGTGSLSAGLGFGGPCLPKDLRAFRRIGEQHRVDMSLLTAVEEINEARVGRLIEKVRGALWVLERKVIAVWGLAFKPGTDDLRGAQSRDIVASLLEEGAHLRLYDPEAMPEFQRQYGGSSERISYCSSVEESADGADAVVVVTEWPEFKQVSLARIKERMSFPLIVDGRNCLDRSLAEELGFEYHGVGR